MDEILRQMILKGLANITRHTRSEKLAAIIRSTKPFVLCRDFVDEIGYAVCSRN